MIACENGLCRIQGPVTVDTLAGLLRELRARRDAVRTLDFSGVGQIDSAVLALVLGARRLAGDELAVRGLPPGFGALAELYGVADLLPA